MQNFKQLYQISRIATEQNHFSMTNSFVNIRNPLILNYLKINYTMCSVTWVSTLK